MWLCQVPEAGDIFAAGGTFLFPFQDVTPENDRPISILETLYISAKLN
jgi:hypothetical protein